MLRVNYVAAKAIDSRNFRCVAGVIVIITGTVEDKPSGENFFFTGFLVQRGNRPAIEFAAPVLGSDFQAKMNFLVDLMMLSGFFDVIANRGAIGKHLGVCPRPKVIAECEHIGVRTDAGIAK